MALETKKVHDVIVVQAAVTTVAGAISSTAGTAVRLPRPENGMVFILNVTAAATDTIDTLDVQVQTRIDVGGVEAWHNVVHFAQVAGDGGVVQHVEKITYALNAPGYESGTALGAGTVRNIGGDEWRVEYVQVDGDSDASFTFSVTACPM